LHTFSQYDQRRHGIRSPWHPCGPSKTAREHAVLPLAKRREPARRPGRSDTQPGALRDPDAHGAERALAAEHTAELDRAYGFRVGVSCSEPRTADGMDEARRY
jgi:hypothetical protein